MMCWEGCSRGWSAQEGRSGSLVNRESTQAQTSQTPVFQSLLHSGIVPKEMMWQWFQGKRETSHSSQVARKGVFTNARTSKNISKGQIMDTDSVSGEIPTNGTSVGKNCPLTQSNIVHTF